jgi:hypothetical protein
MLRPRSDPDTPRHLHPIDGWKMAWHPVRAVIGVVQIFARPELAWPRDISCEAVHKR